MSQFPPKRKDKGVQATPHYPPLGSIGSIYGSALLSGLGMGNTNYDQLGMSNTNTNYATATYQQPNWSVHLPGSVPPRAYSTPPPRVGPKCRISECYAHSISYEGYCIEHFHNYMSWLKEGDMTKEELDLKIDQLNERVKLAVESASEQERVARLREAYIKQRRAYEQALAKEK